VILLRYLWWQVAWCAAASLLILDSQTWALRRSASGVTNMVFINWQKAKDRECNNNNNCWVYFNHTKCLDGACCVCVKVWFIKPTMRTANICGL
jgi:hypothetical protein